MDDEIKVLVAFLGALVAFGGLVLGIVNALHLRRREKEQAPIEKQEQNKTLLEQLQIERELRIQADAVTREVEARYQMERALRLKSEAEEQRFRTMLGLRMIDKDAQESERRAQARKRQEEEQGG